ncbi:MAG TPA: hypothetical protein VLB74_09110 [Flavobacterium sp.]|uniref:hypothetical protein n=1 Tax=Flavobacterium sp. TaxID=239 RepID=UPI002B514B76|nr:hypothetical protein [Flavobacterium sp.]HSD14793.1 hypothetical protein [Flavobacterium sp.]
MGTFVISRKENGLIKFEFNSRRGKTLFTSQSYKTKDDCQKDIAFLKQRFENTSFLKFKTPAGKFFFKLIHKDHIHGISRKFTTELLLAKGLDEMKNNFLESETLDFSEEIFFD